MLEELEERNIQLNKRMEEHRDQQKERLSKLEKAHF